MTTTIRVSEDTKRELEAKKKDNETWDEFLHRITRTEKDIEDIGWLDEGEVDDAKEHMDRKREELNESLKHRKSEMDDSSR